MSLADRLTDEQVERARLLWADHRTLGDIARALDCSIYALSPWLYTEDTPPNAEYRKALGYGRRETA
jgi:hypothetical protein